MNFYTKINDSGNIIDFFEDIKINDNLKELITFMRNLFSGLEYNKYMCIAGGYIYDSLKKKSFDEPSNDIDIFTNFEPYHLDSRFKKLEISGFKPAIFAKNYLKNEENGKDLRGFKYKKLSIHCVETNDIHNLFDLSLCQSGIYIDCSNLDQIKFKASQDFVNDFPNKITILKNNITISLIHSYKRFEKYVNKIGKYPEEIFVITNSNIRIPVTKKINNENDFVEAMSEADELNKMIIDSKCGTWISDPNPKII